MNLKIKKLLEIILLAMTTTLIAFCLDNDCGKITLAMAAGSLWTLAWLRGDE